MPTMMVRTRGHPAERFFNRVFAVTQVAGYLALHGFPRRSGRPARVPWRTNVEADDVITVSAADALAVQADDTGIEPFVIGLPRQPTYRRRFMPSENRGVSSGAFDTVNADGGWCVPKSVHAHADRVAEPSWNPGAVPDATRMESCEAR